MADYSLVKDSSGKVSGIWIKDPTVLDKPGYVETLLFKESAPYLLGDYLAKSYRKVTNNVNSDGGCFIMFGGAYAPGESSDHPYESSKDS